jgi:hypothetical protein
MTTTENDVEARARMLRECLGEARRRVEEIAQAMREADTALAFARNANDLNVALGSLGDLPQRATDATNLIAAVRAMAIACRDRAEAEGGTR